MTFQLAGNGPQVYEKVMVPLWFGRWADALMELLELRPGENVLDVACGTGVTTRMVRDKVGLDGSVTGLDVNAAMIAKAKNLADGLDIGWLERDASDSGLPTGAVDVVLSQHGYHYFPDKPAALAEFRRVLAPGGRMALSIWDGHSAYTKAVCMAVERHISPEIAAKQRAQRQTPSADELSAQLNAAGFSEVRVVRQEIDIEVPPARTFVPLHLGSMPIAAAFDALPDDRKAALIEDVKTEMTPYERGDGLVYPDAVHVAVGRR
ncbi:class I SAM-dependent methyltransferase [Pararhodobacter sp. CCB-MM2]|uniref:class I SAM-dependent methyltransferase n=1 Tax=Pararhodobacter sp. CCB-MM2 TaxID=1786003 RepID=UPI000836A3C5|nr:methyltransferase domain-containing protein [Pararhodobacter sp. CCB-MM2]